MTVSELIRVLLTKDPNANVVVEHNWIKRGEADMRFYSSMDFDVQWVQHYNELFLDENLMPVCELDDNVVQIGSGIVFVVEESDPEWYGYSMDKDGALSLSESSMGTVN